MICGWTEHLHITNCSRIRDKKIYKKLVFEKTNFFIAYSWMNTRKVIRWAIFLQLWFLHNTWKLTGDFVFRLVKRGDDNGGNLPEITVKEIMVTPASKSSNRDENGKLKICENNVHMHFYRMHVQMNCNTWLTYIVFLVKYGWLRASHCMSSNV